MKKLFNKFFRLFNLKVMRYSSHQAFLNHLESQQKLLHSAIKELENHSEQLSFIKRTVPLWFENIATEPSVQIILKDLVRPGDTCFDVGGFQGDLTLVMSRLVGPNGKIITFEANQNVLKTLTANCILNHLTNTFLVNAAVWHTSGLLLEIIDNGVPAGVGVRVPEDLNSSRQIKSITLDEYSEKNELIPNLVKMDIEGAEKHALKGFEKTISTRFPHIILEQNVGDDDSLKFVQKMGYKAFCTNQYNEIYCSADFFPGSQIRNVVCIHKTRIHESNFSRTIKREVVCVFSNLDFDQPRQNLFRVTKSFLPGRYIATVNFESSNESIISFQTVCDNKVLGQYFEEASRFKLNCRDLPFDVDQTKKIEFNIELISNPINDNLFNLKFLQIEKVGNYI